MVDNINNLHPPTEGEGETDKTLRRREMREGPESLHGGLICLVSSQSPEPSYSGEAFGASVSLLVVDKISVIIFRSPHSFSSSHWLLW